LDFYCTSEFQAILQAFTKKKKRQLHSCSKDIPEIFNDANLAKNQWDWATLIVDKDKFSLFKVRVKNSAKGLGKSYGFRVHFAFNKDTKDIIFFGLLSKTEKDIFTKAEYADLIRTLNEETDSSKLMPLDLSSGSIEFRK